MINKNSNNPACLYLTYSELGSSVYESQVISQIDFLNRHDFQFNLFSFYSPRRLIGRRQRRELHTLRSCYEATLHGKTYFRPHLPKRKMWKVDALLQLATVRSLQPAQIFSRGVYATNIALQWKKYLPRLKVVHDSRGAFAAEKEEYGIGAQALQDAIAMERRAVRESDSVVCVSHAMQQYMQSTYGRLARFAVVPCCVDTRNFRFRPQAREQLRRQWNVGNKTVFIYAGSLSPWQMFSETAALIKQIVAAGEDAYFLVLTRDVRSAQADLAQIGFPQDRLRLCSVSHEEMPAYLSAGDVGIVLRPSNVTNRVASPVKIGEYLATGLPVVISPEVGDYSQHVARHNLGFVFDPKVHGITTLLENVKTLAVGNREQRGTEQRLRLSREAHLDTYRDIFGSSLEETTRSESKNALPSAKRAVERRAA